MEDINIFVSYSHADSNWLHDGEFGLIPWLEKVLKRDKINFWYDHDLRKHPFVEYKKKIKNEIDRAQLSVLLLSQDFLISDFIRDFEMPWIKERIDQNKLAILPILVTPLDWEGEKDLKWISEWQILPGKPTPLIYYINDKAQWSQVRVDIMKSIRMRVKEMRKTNGPNPPPPPPPPPPNPQKVMVGKLFKYFIAPTILIILTLFIYKFIKNITPTSQVEEVVNVDTPGNNMGIEKDELENNKSTSTINDINLLKKLDIQAARVTLNSDGSYLATAVSYGLIVESIVGYKGKIELWNIKDNLLVKSISENVGRPGSIKFAPDDKYIAIGGRMDREAEIILWDIKNKYELHILSRNHSQINCLEFSPNSKLLFCAGEESIMIWDVEKRILIGELTGHKKSITDIAIDRKGKLLVSITDGTEMGIWDIVNFKNISFTNINSKGRKVVFLHDSKTIAVGFYNLYDNQPSKIVIYDLESDSIIKTIEGQTGVSINALAFNSSNNLLISGSRNSSVRIGGSLNFYNTTQNYRLMKNICFENDSIDFSDISISRDNKTMATAQSTPKTFKPKVGGHSVSIWNGF